VSGAAAVRLHLIVSGRVQGVFYRASAVSEARRLGLAGWVKNRFDGGVEIVAEGSREGLTSFRAWAEKGPRAARVESVEEGWRVATGEFSGFTIR
jgi:acylphosphatase